MKHKRMKNYTAQFRAIPENLAELCDAMVPQNVAADLVGFYLKERVEAELCALGAKTSDTDVSRNPVNNVIRYMLDIGHGICVEELALSTGDLHNSVLAAYRGTIAKHTFEKASYRQRKVDDLQQLNPVSTFSLC